MVVTSYLILFLGPLLKAPDWILKLSAFNLYGNPIASEINWLGLAFQLIVCVLIQVVPCGSTS